VFEVGVQRRLVGPQLVDLDPVRFHRVGGEAVHEAARLVGSRRRLERDGRGHHLVAPRRVGDHDPGLDRDHLAAVDARHLFHASYRCRRFGQYDRVPWSRDHRTSCSPR
jgi:hypothetical protein